MKSIKPHVIILFTLILCVALLAIAGQNRQKTQELVAPLLDLSTPDRYIPEGSVVDNENTAMRAFIRPGSVKMGYELKPQEFVNQKMAEITISPEGYDAPKRHMIMPSQGAWGVSDDSSAAFATQDGRRYIVLAYYADASGVVHLCVGEGQFNPRKNGPVFSKSWVVEDPSAEEIERMFNDLPGPEDRYRYTFFD